MKKQFVVILLVLSLSARAQIGIGTTSPNSTLDLRGSFSLNYTSFTVNTTAGALDNTLVFTGTSPATLTLPTAVGITGRIYNIKNASSNASVLTIATTSAQTIDGSTTQLLNNSYQTAAVVSNGANWQVVGYGFPSGSGTNWSQGGNAVAGVTNLGTTSAFALPFITGNTERMRITSTGSVGIGTSTFNVANPEKFVVDAGVTSSVNAIVGKGTINNYLQLNIQNLSAGTNASSDVVATADNGTETTNYVDMGINSSVNISGTMGGANDAYLYNIGQNFLIGTGTAAKSLIFMTGGTSQSSNEQMRIDGSGNVGIGINNPTYKLQIVAASNPLYLVGVQTGASTDSIMTIINGVVKKLHPSALATSSSNAWALIGNTNTLASSYFLGTTNTDPLIIKINSQLSGRIDLVNTFLGYQSGFNNSGSTQSTGIGYHSLNANTSGTFNTAIGYNSLPNNITGSNDIGIGNNADVASNSSNSIAMGTNAYSNSSNSIAVGTSAQAVNTYALALGNNTYASGANGIAIGGGPGVPKTQAQGTSSIALGYNAYSGGTNSIAIGTGTNTSATNSVVIGNNTTTIQNNSIILGDATNASLYVGIGTTTPAQKLDVGGNINFSGALMPGGSAGTVGTFLVSTGAGTAPTWFDASGYAWLINGNSVSSIKTLGTTTAFDLPFITNNTEKMRITSVGTVGIGTSTFSGTNPEELIVDAGTNGSGAFQNVIVGKGNTNSYAQLNIQNNSAGTVASSDVVATANNGSETVNYIDMGINGGGNTSAGILGAANNAYLYATGNDFVIGNSKDDKNLIFYTSTATISTERMRITGSTGYVGVGNITPISNMDINGSVGAAIITTITNITLDATNYTVILTGGTPIVTLPAASTNNRRIYILVNQTGGSRTISAYKDYSGANDTAIPQNSSIMIQSNGTSWYRVQ